MGGFIIILVLFAAVWLLFVLPARRRRRAHSAMQDSIDVGNEIITAGGLHGTVTAMGDDVVDVEIAPSVVVRLDRRAIAAVATEVEAAAEPAEPALEAPETDSGPEA
jgi:preprotein translocase subunit YajC